jgi:hypothetical protein
MRARHAAPKWKLAGMLRIVALVVWMVWTPFSLFFTTAAVSAHDMAAISIHEWESLWTKVLTEYVDERGRIAFQALKQNRGDLDKVVAYVATLDPRSATERFPSQHAQLAFYINAYNALAMHGVIDAGIPRSLGGLTKFTFFFLRRVMIGGRSTTLYSFENDVIRPLGDERVHFALNCMVVGCPRLPRTAFTADAIDRQLDIAAQTFVAEARNVRVDPDRNVVWLSAIFKFYTEDFLAHAGGLIEYVNRYRAEKVPPDAAVRFLDYDWTVNDRDRSEK